MSRSATREAGRRSVRVRAWLLAAVAIGVYVAYIAVSLLVGGA
jgi:hypothetical protein